MRESLDCPASHHRVSMLNRVDRSLFFQRQIVGIPSLQNFGAENPYDRHSIGRGKRCPIIFPIRWYVHISFFCTHMLPPFTVRSSLL